MDYNVKLEAFEGPLDLLLHLIRKNDIDIYDIPIAEITSQYLEYIEIMQTLSLDIAGEFLVMAATLVQIKSEMLLPEPQLEEDEEEDPRAELVKKLLEYRKIREATKSLRERELAQKGVYARDSALFKDEDYTVEATLFDLLDAFRKIVLEVKEERVKEIIPETITIEERIEGIIGALKDREFMDFSDIFGKESTKMFLIVSFLALLELIRQKKVYVRQSKTFGNIRIYRGESSNG